MTSPQVVAWALAALALALVLALGTALGRIAGSRQWGVPEALLAGGLGLLLGPAGPLPQPLLPASVLAVWAQLPPLLLTLVFSSLLLGKALPSLGGLWRPLTAQVLLSLTLAFGQYLVAAVMVQLLMPLPGIHPLMACLIEVAYEGGHAAAAAIGPTYARLGFAGGEALGLALATVGLLSSTLLGGVVVVLARRWGWLQANPAPAVPRLEATNAAQPALPAAGAGGVGAGGVGAGGVAAAGAATAAAGPLQAARAWALNLALAGLAVGLGWLILEGMRWLADWQGGGFQTVIEALPVFPLAIVGSLLVRLALERSGRSGVASAAIQSLVASLAADLLITAATACLDISLLVQDWLPLTALAVSGLVWNLAVVLLFGRLILPAPWFERAILEFGQATGVAASGLLLLRMADPHDQADVLPAFSIKQLLLQPLLAGGVLTAIAPLLVMRLGLPLWSGLCLILVLVWIGLGLLLARR
jgi:ESS family glutamate:Na+ symporter